jgi:hypothetical protein
MKNDISWAYKFNGFDAANVIAIDDKNQRVYIDLIRSEKKLSVELVALLTLIFMIAGIR